MKISKLFILFLLIPVIVFADGEPNDFIDKEQNGSNIQESIKNDDKSILTKHRKEDNEKTDNNNKTNTKSNQETDVDAGVNNAITENNEFDINLAKDGYKCEPTNEIEVIIPTPEDFITSNNLRHKVGSIKFARGEMLIITGTLQDSSCLPITNAKIELWQANNKGIYQQPFQKNGDIKVIDKNFASNGTAFTDNLGKFTFSTILPGKYEDNTEPHINININHQDYQPFSSAFFIVDKETEIDYLENKIFMNKKNKINSLHLNVTLSEGKNYKIY